MRAENSTQAIDERIDSQLKRIKVDHPTYRLVNKVYRPYVKEAILAEAKGVSTRDFVDASVILIANMISELSVCTGVQPSAVLASARDFIAQTRAPTGRTN